MRDIAAVRCKCIILGFAYAASGKEGGELTSAAPLTDVQFRIETRCLVDQFTDWVIVLTAEATKTGLLQLRPKASFPF